MNLSSTNSKLSPIIHFFKNKKKGRFAPKLRQNASCLGQYAHGGRHAPKMHNKLIKHCIITSLLYTQASYETSTLCTYIHTYI